jgi:hypothetical protein
MFDPFQTASLDRHFLYATEFCRTKFGDRPEDRQGPDPEHDIKYQQADDRDNRVARDVS